MKILQRLVLSAALLFSCFSSRAITNTVITASGTNIILSWPSFGYESYLIQSCPDLSSNTWTNLLNAYPANSTNFTTFTNFGVLTPIPCTNCGSGGNTNGGGSPPAPGDTNSGSWGTNTYAMDVQAGFYRVFHIPNWLASFSGHAFGGPTFIPVDFASPDAPTNEVEGTTVLINGQPTDNAVFTPDVIGGITNWGVGIYFDRFPNGTNTIQLLTTVRQSDILNDQTPYMVFSNAPQNIVISNFVTYTNWSDLILSNTYTFNAHSSTTNVDWEIDIYDQNGDFVNSQTNHSTDGNISWSWDLTDYTGASRANPDDDPVFFPHINITASAGDPGGWTPPVAASFPGTGSWLFAYMDNMYDDGTTNYAGADHFYTNGIHTMEAGPVLYSIPISDYPIKFGRVYTQTNRNASWQTLADRYLSFFPIRNFYYFGHGAPNGIGGDQSTLDSSNNITGSTTLRGSTAYLTSQWVHDNLTFNKYGGARPYRFVWLDGCSTAAGNWAAAWGIPSQPEPLSFYQGTNNPSQARPSVFCGWDVDIGGSKAWGTIQNFWEFRKDWMATWAVTVQSVTLSRAFATANNVSGWVDNGLFNSHFKVVGYSDMGFFDYNHQSDWP